MIESSSSDWSLSSEPDSEASSDDFRAHDKKTVKLKSRLMKSLNGHDNNALHALIEGLDQKESSSLYRVNN